MRKEFLNLTHELAIRKACTTLSLHLSEYNFSNLYLFRKTHTYQVLFLAADRFALLGTSYASKPFLMPLFLPEDWSELVHLAREENASYIYPIPEAWVPGLEQQGFTVSYHEEDSDYLYEVAAIASYKGRHLDGQRNAVRGLLSHHTTTYSPLLENGKNDAVQIVDAWEKNKHEERSDADACREAIERRSTMESLIFEVDGKKVGLIMGDSLTSDTFLVHFAKTSTPIHGLYQYMYQEYAKKLAPTYTWMNWEQDLGLEALRHAKKSYHPFSVIRKGHLSTL